MSPFDHEKSSGHGTTDPLIPAKQAEVIMAAVAEALTSAASSGAQVRTIFSRVQPLFGAGTEFQIYLISRLDREPGPLLLDRIWFGEVYDRLEPRPFDTIQKQIDSRHCGADARLARARMFPRVSYTSTLSELVPPEEEELIRTTMMAKVGFKDILFSDWLGSPDRFVTLHTLRKTSEPFSRTDAALCNLLMRGLGPLVMESALSREPSPISRLSPIQLRTLRAMLSGARVSDASTVARLLAFFGAPTREELVAQFIDEAAIMEIDESLRIQVLEEADRV